MLKILKNLGRFDLDKKYTQIGSVRILTVEEWHEKYSNLVATYHPSDDGKQIKEMIRVVSMQGFPLLKAETKYVASHTERPEYKVKANGHPDPFTLQLRAIVYGEGSSRHEAYLNCLRNIISFHEGAENCYFYE